MVEGRNTQRVRLYQKPGWGCIFCRPRAARSQYSTSTIISKAAQQYRWAGTCDCGRNTQRVRLYQKIIRYIWYKWWKESQYSTSTIISKDRRDCRCCRHDYHEFVAILNEYDYIKSISVWHGTRISERKVAILNEYDYIKSIDRWGPWSGKCAGRNTQRVRLYQKADSGWHAE